MMIRSWSSKNPARVDPDALTKKASESIAKTRAQQPRVNAFSRFLGTRLDQNGFGEDFEYTLRPRGAK